jgi:hypothetical protein
MSERVGGHDRGTLMTGAQGVVFASQRKLLYVDILSEGLHGCMPSGARVLIKQCERVA